MLRPDERIVLEYLAAGPGPADPMAAAGHLRGRRPALGLFEAARVLYDLEDLGLVRREGGRAERVAITPAGRVALGRPDAPTP
ncbi:hypothetical protein [Tautonia plasticadhaerens]|uniref:Uncharacterized protein n=1 Tax=Tautonia plasticadhaerens TaxID=2527974 RepID=A0A518GZJ0_9BACT|nr:hypothetical protein [Tautonia plasticadhaerens]QDV34005.1 hypothetical protein ElP_18860 [Tautonia plasticadhaerens]